MRKKLYLNALALSIGLLLSFGAAEIFLRVQNFLELDGFHDKHPWNSVLHHGDNAFAESKFGSSCSDGRLRVLLLGDSWMEDPVLSESIGSQLSKVSGMCIDVVNGGNSSYSPTVYLLKSRQAFEKYGLFDYIIVNVDETDIGDEWLRYRIPLTRNRDGEILAVPYENDIQSEYVWNGKLWAENSNFYVVRFLKFAFLYEVLVPSIRNLTDTPDTYSNLMRYVFDTPKSRPYEKEYRYFFDRLSEMASVLTQETHGAGAVYVTHHPHLRGVVGSVSDGQKYSTIVSDLLEELHEASGVNVLDARDDIKELHGENLFKNTYVDGDPFSHLAEEGARRYGQWIAGNISIKESFKKDIGHNSGYFLGSN